MTISTFSSSTSRQRSGIAGSAGTRARPEHWARGRVLSGRLRIESLIGMGSMGMVLEARHLELDTRVAVKAILPRMQAVPGMVALFAREAKAAVGIHSEHVAQVYDVGTDDELGPYIVMEYLEGQDLRALLDVEGRMPPARAIDHVLQACEALAVAHARGVIHRDIKPGNLFLTRQGELEIIKLLDFGVSKAALRGRLFGDELSEQQAAELMGTPLYMSPEQIRAPYRVDARSDIWALGAVLYELVTGCSAFPSTDALPQLLSRICESAPPPLAHHCAGLPPLQGIIDQCLDKNPARRFQNVAELAYALFPLASARSRLHAHRAACILGTPGAAALLPAAGARQARPQLVNAARSPVDELPARAQRPHRVLPASQHGGHRSRSAGRWLAPCALLASLLGPGTSEEAAQRASSDGVTAASEAHPAPGSRTVLIESQPSGAMVSSEGQGMGLTPLSALVPSGAVLLSLAKPGYSKARELLLKQEDRQAAPRPARITLRQLAEAHAATASVPAARSHAARAAKPRGAASVAAPSAGQRAKPPSSPAVPPPAPASAERPRLRLVEDPPPLHVASRL